MLIATPVPVLVVTAPSSVVVPEPVVCTRLAALTDLSAAALRALLMRIAPSAAAVPTSSLNLMSLPPAVNVSAWPPSRVELKVISPLSGVPEPPLLMVSGRFRVTPVAKLTLSADVVIVRVPAPPTVTRPAPFCVNAPVVLMLSSIASVCPAAVPLVSVTVPVAVVVMPATAPFSVPFPSVSVSMPPLTIVKPFLSV